MENFRCFRERQDVRLAPLTLLVGENSTGKTSFLALIRALADAGHRFINPDFKEPPYDLGSYQDIVHTVPNGVGPTDEFVVGFNYEYADLDGAEGIAFEFKFSELSSAPSLLGRRYTSGLTWISENFGEGPSVVIHVGTAEGRWRMRLGETWEFPNFRDLNLPLTLLPLMLLRASLVEHPNVAESGLEFEVLPEFEGPPFGPEDEEKLRSLVSALGPRGTSRPFASAPVRSRPRRTYDPMRPAPDPEGDYVPMYLADLAIRNPEAWNELKRALEAFGSRAGLFDEIRIKRFGHASDPFQLQVRKTGPQGPDEWRNFVDVGYGVSQALPVVLELFRPEAPRTSLLQQPEVHLHPSAQAALGTLFCELAGSDEHRRQLIVETHSDHLINRVRMDIRDGTTGLGPDDVMVLFFERDGLEVNIHEIRFNGDGNVVGAPDSYGRFFMDEVSRDLWP